MPGPSGLDSLLRRELEIFKRVRIGVVGLGFGLNVQIPCFLSNNGFDVVGVAGSSVERGLDTIGKAHLKLPVYSWEELVRRDDIDAVCVSVPPGFQYEIACQALLNGKHVLCEKPCGMNAGQAADMLRHATTMQVVHAVDFQFRMDPCIQLLYESIDRGLIGKVKRIDVQWVTGGRVDPDLPWSWQYDSSAGGGSLNAFGSHVIDYIQWICQSLVAVVNGARTGIMLLQRNDGGILKEVSAEDVCDFLLTLNDQTVCNVGISNTIRYGCGHSIQIYGAKGRLVYNNAKPYLRDSVPTVKIENDKKGLSTMTGFENTSKARPITDSRQFAFGNLADAFLDKIQGESVPHLPDFKSGVVVQKVIAAIRYAASNMCPVEVSDLDQLL